MLELGEFNLTINKFAELDFSKCIKFKAFHPSFSDRHNRIFLAHLVYGYAHGAGVQSNMSLSQDFICLYHHSYLR